MNIVEIVAAFYRLTDSTAVNGLWDEPEVVLLANLATNDAVERGLLIEDDTTAAICDITIVANTVTYALDPRILKIKRARSVTFKRTVYPTSPEEMDRGNYSHHRHFLNTSWDTATGHPRAYIEMGSNLRLVPIPSVDDAWHLTVYRLPLKDMVIGTQDQPEIRVERHYDLLDGMLARAYSKHDSEAFDPKAAAEYEARFTQHFGEKRDANVLRKQRESRSHVTQINW